MELKDDVAVKHRAPFNTASQSRRVIDEVDDVPATEDLWPICCSRAKAAPTCQWAPWPSHREELARLVRARRSQAQLAKVDPTQHPTSRARYQAALGRKCMRLGGTRFSLPMREELLYA